MDPLSLVILVVAVLVVGLLAVVIAAAIAMVVYKSLGPKRSEE